MTVTAYLLAALIGVSLGLLGGGGSTLAVPVLAYVVHLPPKEAIATSLIVVGATSLVGAFRHFAARNVDFRAAMLFGIASMASAFVGGRIAVFIADWVQLTIFALVMIAAALSMLQPRPQDEAPAAHSLTLMIAAAVGVGLLTGVVGVGGGFLIVPSMVLFARLPMKLAVGTSLLVIAMNSGAAFAGYAGIVRIPAKVTIFFTLSAFVGVAIGSWLVHRVSTIALRKAFAIFLIVVAGFVLYENHKTILSHLHRPKIVFRATSNA